MSSETSTEEPQLTTETTTTTTTMQDPQQQEATSPTSLTQKLNKMKITPSFTIWPPTQRTRDAVTTRLIETLSTPSSVLSKRYGIISPDDASLIAKSIELDAFNSAAAAADTAAADDSIDAGIEILQVYSKEISKLVLQSVKSKSNSNSNSGGAAGVAEVNDVGSSLGDARPPAGDDAGAVSEEVSNADNESVSA